MPKKKKIRCFEDIIEEMKEQEAMSCSPGIPHLKANYITDPDKSVNWNRLQVIQNNETREKTIIKLNKEKNDWRAKLDAELQGVKFRKTSWTCWKFLTPHWKGSAKALPFD